MLHLIGQTTSCQGRRLLSACAQPGRPLPLSMKSLRKRQWAVRDNRKLKLCLKHLSRIGAYVAMVAVPGGLAVLPVMAWWRSRRRGKRAAHDAE